MYYTCIQGDAVALKESELEQIYDKMFRLGMKSSHSFDLYGEDRVSSVYHFKEGIVDKNFHIKDSGISLRINENGRTGFAGSSLDIVDFEKLIHDAAPSSSIPSDLTHLDFPTIEKSAEVKGIYDNDLAAFSCDDIEELLQSVVGASSEQISSMDGYIRLYAKEWIIGNCHGEQAAVKETYIRILVRTYARLLFKNTMNVEYQDGRSLKQINPEYLGESCSKKAVESLKYKKMKSANVSVVLDPSIVSNLVYSIAREMLSAGNIYRKVSCLDTDSRLGSVTLIDSGTIPGGLRSSAVDGEGVKKGIRNLIENGRIVSYLHNLATSDKFNVPPTGTCSRVGYAVRPAIAPSNLIVEPGEIYSQKIVEETKEGVYFGLSFDVPNVTNGDYFLTAQNAFEIKNGEIGEPVRFPGINTTVFKFFDSVDMISKDTVVLNGVISPTVRLSTVRVSPSPAVYSGGLLW